MVDVILFFVWLYIGVKNLFFRDLVDKFDYFMAWLVVITGFIVRIAT